MARTHRDFGPPEGPSAEGVTFTLSGPGWSETFTTVAEAPSGVLNDLVSGITYDDEGNRIYRAPNLIHFVIGVLREEKAVALDGEGKFPDDLGMTGLPSDVLTAEEAEGRGLDVPEGAEKVAVVPADDVGRFFALMHDKRRIVNVERLGELVIWLAEELSSRPTQPSTASRRGRR